MALEIKNSLQLIDPANLKLKILLVSMPGFGKTTFLANAPDPMLGVCETGHGKGLLSVATKGVSYVEINNYNDFDLFCSGTVGKDKLTLGLDSLSEMARTFIKDKALTIPRTKGESLKRQMGVPEQDDYGTIGELTRKLTKKLIDQPKHIIATCTLRIKEKDPDTGVGETLIGPDLAGAMFLGSTAMFDIVLIGRTRSKLRDPKDAKTRYLERYWLTENANGFIAKNRLCTDPKMGSFLPPELLYDLETGSGSFDDILRRAKEAYELFLNKKLL
jgi:hypothetical protein